MLSSIFKDGKIAFGVDYSKREDCVEVIDFTQEQIYKLQNGCKYENGEIIETPEYLEARLKEIGNRMRVINDSIIQLGGPAQIIEDLVVDPIRQSKINELKLEYNTLKIERDTNYTTDVINDVFNSFFD